MLHLLPFVINLYKQPTDKGVHIGFFYTGSDPIQHSSYPTLSLLSPHPDFWRPLIITDKRLIRQLGHSDKSCFPCVCWIGQISTFYIFKIKMALLTKIFAQ